MKYFYLLLSAFISFTLNSQQVWQAADLRIRDPFIFADSASGTYYLYRSGRAEINGSMQNVVDVFTGKDLKTWNGPSSCFILPENFWATNMIWAPEMHKYQGKYYLFVTFTSFDTLLSTPENPAKPARYKPFKRGTQVLWSDSPSGPFHILDNRSTTPQDWMCLDGTFYEEDGIPYMIFCHEWLQINDGTVNAVRLKSDLSAMEGAPFVLFKASDAPWVVVKPQGNVTDGPFMYRTKSGKLLMIWSSFGKSGYAELIAYSESGKIAGPWKQLPEPLFTEDGGHGMIFKTFEGNLMFVYHQPNKSPDERLKLIQLDDPGNMISKAKP